MLVKYLLQMNAKRNNDRHAPLPSPAADATPALCAPPLVLPPRSGNNKPDARAHPLPLPCPLPGTALQALLPPPPTTSSPTTIAVHDAIKVKLHYFLLYDIIYDIVYDVVWYITCDIVYDIVYTYDIV
jgi:hypothetical protein